MISGNFISVKSIADRLMMNPMLKDLNFEFIVDKTVECLRLVNMPPIYIPKKVNIGVNNFRGELPIDMIYLKQAFLYKQGQLVPMFSAQDNIHEHLLCFQNNNVNLTVPRSTAPPAGNPPMWEGQGTSLNLTSSTSKEGDNSILTFSLTNSKIYTNFEEGEVVLAYQSIAVDEECYPLVPDNIKLIRAIESYIKYRWFDILNDMDKVSDRKLSKAESDYSWNIGQAQSDMIMPNETEMEALVNSITKILPSTNQFENRMKYLGNKEYLRTH